MFAPWKKSYAQPGQHIQKQRDYFAEKVPSTKSYGFSSSHVWILKAMVFPVVTYGYESWTIKKAECQRTDAFELWCWGRLLRVPWTARRLNQSILKEINPVFIGRTDANAETAILWPADAKN